MEEGDSSSVGKDYHVFDESGAELRAPEMQEDYDEEEKEAPFSEDGDSFAQKQGSYDQEDGRQNTLLLDSDSMIMD